MIRDPYSNTQIRSVHRLPRHEISRPVWTRNKFESEPLWPMVVAAVFVVVLFMFAIGVDQW